MGHLILQNAWFVEDDRTEIPVLSIGDDYSSLQFAIIQYDKIR